MLLMPLDSIQPSCIMQSILVFFAIQSFSGPLYSLIRRVPLNTCFALRLESIAYLVSRFLLAHNHIHILQRYTTMNFCMHIFSRQHSSTYLSASEHIRILHRPSPRQFSCFRASNGVQIDIGKFHYKCVLSSLPVRHDVPIRLHRPMRRHITIRRDIAIRLDFFIRQMPNTVRSPNS